MYQAIFSSRANRAFQKFSKKDAVRIKEVLKKLEQEPRMHGTIKLASAPVAAYRYRVGNFRILFDIDDEQKIIAVLDIRKRDERTYR